MLKRIVEVLIHDSSTSFFRSRSNKAHELINSKDLVVLLNTNFC